MFTLRRLLHGFFAFAVLLGSLAAEPHAVATPIHPDCCCGNESLCPCEPVQPPQAPRGPCAPASPASQAALPAAPRLQIQADSKLQPEPRPWEGRESTLAFRAGRGESTILLLPRDLPRPPDRSLQKLASLGQFRI